MMCFVPATFEIVGIVLLAPKLMGLSILEAAIMGAVLAAVSPAVVVPRMVKLMEEGYGVKQGDSAAVLAGASVDGTSMSRAVFNIYRNDAGTKYIYTQFYQYSGFYFPWNWDWIINRDMSCVLL